MLKPAVVKLNWTKQTARMLDTTESMKNSFSTRQQHLLAVLASSFCTAAIIYPMDVVRALQMTNSGAVVPTRQLLKKFRSSHGIVGFFRQGVVPEISRATWIGFVKFSLFPVCRTTIALHFPCIRSNVLVDAAAGVLSSIPEAVSIMPLEVSKILLQTDSLNKFKNSVVGAIRSVYRRYGLRGLTVGYTGVQLRQALLTSVYFVSLPFFTKGILNMYESTEQQIDDSVKAISNFLGGFLAGYIASAVSSPADRIRSIVQKSVLVGSSGIDSVNFIGTLREVVVNLGPAELFNGFRMKALHGAGGGALMAFFVPFYLNMFENYTCRDVKESQES